jgi:predicted short-subunit dehydrogenase-like oxidoreductase (DUF2520 family)
MALSQIKKKVKAISLIGAGKVSRQLALRMQQKGVQIHQIYNRTPEKGQEIAELVGASYTNQILQLDLDKIDMLIIAVNDSAIKGIVHELVMRKPTCLIVHTSGATHIRFDGANDVRLGGFYPLMSFAEGRQITWTKTPICIDAIRQNDLLLLEHLSRKLGAKTYHITDDMRVGLHTAAVFANNFTNHLLGIAFDALRQIQAPKQILAALIEETFERALANDPHQIQTGPAVRHDEQTIALHLEYLKNEPEKAQLYALMTKMIQDRHSDQ